MKDQIHPCLWFDGKAKEAAELYCSLFKNSKITSENPMVVMWELNGLKVMGLNGGPMFKMNPSISLFVLCETVEETKKLWDKLMEGGKALIPLEKQEWSELYGWLQDKFGFTWQISVVPKKGDKQSIIPSMLFTDKYFGKAEEAAKFYTSVFVNSKQDMTMLYPNGDPNNGKVMYSEFNLGGYKIAAMDGPGVHDYRFDEGVSFVVNCKSQTEIDHYWNRFTSDGGQESMCGWCKDKFGVWWQVIPANLGEMVNDPVRGQKVVAAFMKMKKFNIAELENA